jgi:uncharacterized membrane protein YdbT with pleckstrin-like domain
MNDSEALLWRGTSSQKKNVGLFIFCILTCWLILPILVALFVWLESKSLEYKLTTQRLQRSRGFFEKRKDDIELYRVRDISYQQSLSYRLLGLANIIVYSTDQTDPRMIIEAVEATEAEELRETMRHYVEIERTKRRLFIVDN